MAELQWADKDMGHFYEEFMKILDKALLSLYEDFPTQVTFGQVSGANASKSHYQVWGANAVNVSAGRGNKIEGGGMARAFDTQQPGVFGIVTTPKHGPPDNNEDYGEFGDGGKKAAAKPLRRNVATKRTHVSSFDRPTDRKTSLRLFAALVINLHCSNLYLSWLLNNV